MDLDEITAKILPHLKVGLEKAMKVGGDFLVSQETEMQVKVLAGIARYLLNTLDLSMKEKMAISKTVERYAKHLKQKAEERAKGRRAHLFSGVHS